MELNFILTYFAAKKLSLITAFLCWKPEQELELWHGAHSAGLRLNIQKDFGRLPPLPPYDLHREGVVLDVNCPDAALVLDKASATRAFNLRHSWLLLDDAPFNVTAAEHVLADALVLPDGDVAWSSTDALVDVYRVKAKQPLVVTVIDADRNCTRHGLETLWAQLPSVVERRKNLHNVYLPAIIVLTQPQHFKTWTDQYNRQIDTFSKVAYQLMTLCSQDLNFRYNLRQVDVYGVEHNGTFSGVAGSLQRGRSELGVACMFMRGDRWRVLHFAAETVDIIGAFMFRQPAKSSVANVFRLPFAGGVWCACGALLAAAGALLAAAARLLARADPQLARLSPPETTTFIIGAVCQQGTYTTSQMLSVRAVMFSVLLASVFTFTSYSAKIVVILQTPSNAIQTIADITNSRMGVGVQETTYKETYFAESTDPATRRLYRHKLLPLGERAYMSVVDGIERVRTDFFAFQVEQSPGYDIISKTYTEREKCELKEIQAFKVPQAALPIRKHSGYKELIATRMRWLREVGLLSHTRRRWMAARVVCAGGGGGFVSVGVRDAAPALRVLALGALLAALLLAAERALMFFKLRRKK